MNQAAIKQLIQALPRCTFQVHYGLEKRCPRIGTHVLEQPNGARDYGAQLCREHATDRAKHLGYTMRELRYTGPLIRVADELGVDLKTDDIFALGVSL